MNRDLLHIAAVASGVAMIAGWVASCTVPTQPEAEHFPIIGLHEDLACGACHVDTLKGAPNTCEGCHEKDRPADHYAGDCGECHSELGWEYAVVDHDQYLSLEGGHSPLLCSDCHDPDDYTTLDAACDSCHAADEPPNHFGPPCETCHDVYDWGDADFTHPYFPIPHRGVDTCTECHPASNYNDFTCTDCHAHSQSEMDDEHQGEVNNYVYDSDACLNCHPNGQEDDD
jgi:hypothetical protein